MPWVVDLGCHQIGVGWARYYTGQILRGFVVAGLQRLVPMRKRHLGMLLLIGTMLAATATSITGCGKKGPLYLPDATQEQPDNEQSEKKSKKQKQ